MNYEKSRYRIEKELNRKYLIGALIVLGLIILSGFGVPSYAMTTVADNSNSSSGPAIIHKAHRHYIPVTVTTDDMGNTKISGGNHFVCGVTGCHAE